jgi:hypothetical protein
VSESEWVLVPREPTEAMVNRGRICTERTARGIWAQMISAAPPAPASDEAVEAMARAHYALCPWQPGTWEELSSDVRDAFIAAMRAALPVQSAPDPIVGRLVATIEKLLSTREAEAKALLACERLLREDDQELYDQRGDTYAEAASAASLAEREAALAVAAAKGEK